MATAQKILISPQNTGLLGVKQTDEAANKASQLLQKDLESFHVFFNQDGFHNHLVHHILTLYGTGADPAALQQGFDGNTGYQRPVQPNHDRVIEDLQTWSHASKYVGKEQYYPDFLAFFQREIDSKGWEAVLAEYLFTGTEAADDLLVRLYAGVLHPLIQLMYGMEWNQPAIVAEGLAQTCVHKDNFKDELLAAERNANDEYGKTGAKMPTIASLLREVRENQKLATAARFEDGNKIRDGVFGRARDEMVAIMSKVKVRPEEIEEKTAEMFNTAVFMAAGATFHPPKINKFDFFLMHHANSCPIFLTFNAQPWLSAENKARLLEWKIRYDLFQYAARGVPNLSLDEIKAYQPKAPTSASGAEVALKIHRMSDDGHAIKLARAASICEQITKKYQDKEWVLIKGDDTWKRVHHLILDSLQSPGEYWVRSAGMDEAWKNFPNVNKL
ncbi:HypA protein [Diaporthe amygdali]|uniref:HypA protein n=1 Tax=Phomopsis amygdali TaxID=1214568 RepID=UPI0022FF451A|nr:HypA protein [Diaporthe amygdali]KAJ0117104.1 HypA protein [Diaporthe amygdali]